MLKNTLPLIFAALGIALQIYILYGISSMRNEAVCVVLLSFVLILVASRFKWFYVWVVPLAVPPFIKIYYFFLGLPFALDNLPVYFFYVLAYFAWLPALFYSVALLVSYILKLKEKRTE